MANDWICVANRKYLFFFNEIIKRQGITESGNIRKKENILESITIKEEETSRQ